MKVKMLKPVTVRNASNGNLTSYACGQIVDMDSTPAGQMIEDGIAEAYTLLTPTGNKEITANGTDIDVAQYATVSVAVE